VLTESIGPFRRYLLNVKRAHAPAENVQNVPPAWVFPRPHDGFIRLEPILSGRTRYRLMLLHKKRNDPFERAGD
jgi:hypothetical protein